MSVEAFDLLIVGVGKAGKSLAMDLVIGEARFVGPLCGPALWARARWR